MHICMTRDNLRKNEISYTTIRQYLYPPQTDILATRLVGVGGLTGVRTENSIESILFFRSSLKTGQAKKPAWAGPVFRLDRFFFSHRDVYKHRPRPVQFNHSS